MVAKGDGESKSEERHGPECGLVSAKNDLKYKDRVERYQDHPITDSQSFPQHCDLPSPIPNRFEPLSELPWGAEPQRQCLVVTHERS